MNCMTNEQTERAHWLLIDQYMSVIT